jgi:hypothetical protein
MNGRHTFEVAEGDIGRRENRRHGLEKTKAVVVGQYVLGKIRARHDVSHRRQREAGMRGRGQRGGRSRGRDLGHRRPRLR